MRQNLFIALEGIDGSGKSTQVELLCQNLKKAGHKVYSTCEPTDSPIGSIIRNIFSRRIEADHKTIAGLFVADRLDHLLNKTNGLLKKLEEGYTVVTDRYYFSSFAYQAPFMPLDWIIEANSLSAELLRPDLNIYIDISPEVSMSRITKSRSSLELYETKENLHNVREKYFEAIKRLEHVENVCIVNGDMPVDNIAAEVWKAVSGLSVEANTH